MKFFNKKFFMQDAADVAKQLLGHFLCRKMQDGQIIRGIIVETEAYMPNDPACHASRGMTKRNAPMFEEGGMCYVYLIYGMYHCLNIVTGQKGSGQAVLFRALQMLNEPNLKIASGPGKLCKHLKIDKSNNHKLFSKKNCLWLEKNPDRSQLLISCSPRIGISLAKDLHWRFFISDNKSVSKFK